MSFSHGDGDEMGNKDHGISADEADQLLGGRVPAGRDDLSAFAADLTSLSEAYVHEVDPGLVKRWATEAAGHTHLIPTDKGDLAATPASNADGPASQAAGLPKRRTPVLKTILAFLATTGGKAAAAAAVVAASATGGLAATGNLPSQSDTPDRVVTTAGSEADDDVPEADTGGVDALDDEAVGAQGDDCADEADEADETDQADEADQADEVDAPDAADEAESCDDEVQAPEVEAPEVEAPDTEDDADEVETDSPDQVDDHESDDADDSHEADEVDSDGADSPDQVDDHESDDADSPEAGDDAADSEADTEH